MMQPALDEAALARQTGGDAELAVEVLRLFLEAISPDARRARDLPPMMRSRMAHRTKGAAGGIGARPLEAAAMRLADAPEDGGALDAFLAALGDAEAAIRDRIGEG